MQLTLISDTHGIHSDLKLPPGETLIHAGDISEYGSEEEIMDFVRWFGSQAYKHKIFIAGNHDTWLEESSLTKFRKLLPKDVHYLQEDSISIEGINFFGSPYTLYYMGMAFNARTARIIKHWNKIPKNTTVLITHGPPLGIMSGDFGSETLMEQVNIIKPKLHVFGHAHGYHGVQQEQKTFFANAALLKPKDPMSDEEYRIIFKPIVVEVN